MPLSAMFWLRCDKPFVFPTCPSTLVLSRFDPRGQTFVRSWQGVPHRSDHWVVDDHEWPARELFSTIHARLTHGAVVSGRTGPWSGGRESSVAPTQAGARHG
jgi:hypothetical protein